MFCVLAEYERALISERTKAGLAAARRQGRYPGRPAALTPDQIEYACAEIEAKRSTQRAMAAELRVHVRTLSRAMSKARREEA